VVGNEEESKADLYMAAGAGASAEDLTHYGLDHVENLDALSDSERSETDAVHAPARDSELSFNSWDAHPPLEIKQPSHNLHNA
jgi:hypothetical protein